MVETPSIHRSSMGAGRLQAPHRELLRREGHYAELYGLHPRQMESIQDQDDTARADL